MGVMRCLTPFPFVNDPQTLYGLHSTPFPKLVFFLIFFFENQSGNFIKFIFQRVSELDFLVQQ